MYKVETHEPPERFFEDFAEGQQMPVVTRGPMTATDQVKWAGACDNYASDFHHDSAAAREKGLPGLVLSGPFMACILMTEVAKWLGRRARLVSFSNRNTAPTSPGDLAHIQATVKRAWTEGGKGLVELDCQILNQDQKGTTPATLVAELPLRGA